MSKLNRSEFKELLLEWNKNFINERTTASMAKNLKDIASSNTQSLSNYRLKTKMQRLPALIVDIDNRITQSDEVFQSFLSTISQDSNLSNPTKKAMDDPDTGEGMTLLQWENNANVLRSLLSILKSFSAVNINNIAKEDIENSSIIIFKDTSFDEDDPYAKEENGVESNIYNNALWTLHDVMHRVNEDQFGTDRFDEKSFEENEDEIFEVFFEAVSQAVSHSSDKFKKHMFYTGDDFTPSYIVFLYMYIIEVENNRVNIVKSLNNLQNFLSSIVDQNQEIDNEEAAYFSETVSTKTQNILEDINKFLERSYIQLVLYKGLY